MIYTQAALLLMFSASGTCRDDDAADASLLAGLLAAES